MAISEKNFFEFWPKWPNFAFRHFQTAQKWPKFEFFEKKKNCKNGLKQRKTAKNGQKWPKFEFFEKEKKLKKMAKNRAKRQKMAKK